MRPVGKEPPLRALAKGCFRAADEPLHHQTVSLSSPHAFMLSRINI
jgi:hypothetical protein